MSCLHLSIRATSCDLCKATVFDVSLGTTELILADSLNEGVIQGYLHGLRCLHSLGYVHGDIEPRHLCVTLLLRPAIIDLGEARPLGVCTGSPKKVWSYRGKAQSLMLYMRMTRSV